MSVKSKRKVLARHNARRPVGFVKVIKENPCRPGTGHWKRYEKMRKYLASHKKVTREMLLDNCDYNSADFSWDLERGSIAIVKTAG